jgi:hypothetical protein
MISCRAFAKHWDTSDAGVFDLIWNSKSKDGFLEGCVRFIDFN